MHHLDGASSAPASDSRPPLASSNLAFARLILRRRWPLLLGATLGAACVAGWLGWIKAPQTATTTLDVHPIHAPALAQWEAGPALGEASLRASVRQYLRSSDFLRAASASAGVPVSTSFIADHLQVEVLEEGGQMSLSLSGGPADPLLLVLNACVKSAMDWANRFQSDEAKALAAIIDRRLADTERQLRMALEDLKEPQRIGRTSDMAHDIELMAEDQAQLERRRADVSTQLETTGVQVVILLREIRRHHPALLEVRQALDKALLDKTEAHPEVKELRAQLQRLQQRLSEETAEVDPEVAMHGSTLAQELYGQVLALNAARAGLEQELTTITRRLDELQEAWKAVPESESAYHRSKARHDSLRVARDFLLQCQGEASVLLAQAPQFMRLVHSPYLEPPDAATRWSRAATAGAGGAIGGGVLSFLLLLLVEGRSRRILSPAELGQVTQLPLLASLENMNDWTPAQRRQWAFETLTALKGRLNKSPGEPLVCGLVSASHGEGRTTWVQLLAEAARERGFRVVTLSGGPSGAPGQADPSQSDLHPVPLQSPVEIGKLLRHSHQAPPVNLLAGDWVWNLQCRQQWQEAISQCHEAESLVVLVDLPPASEPECMLLAENLSHVIWLCGHEMADMDETRKWIDMLHHARADVVGTVYNRPRAKSPRRRLRAAAAMMWAAAVICCPIALPGQDATPPPAPEAVRTNISAMSVNSPTQLSAWQERLTLGPGDVIDLEIFRRPETLRQQLTVGPDGRLSYLQARDVPVTGLSVDELRTKLETVLTNFYQPPIRVVAIPRAFNSKKYFLLGNVNRRGVYNLEQPLTIMEAIAKAQGFEKFPGRRDTFVLTDLTKSFLVRKDPEGVYRRQDVNFENLFLRGDLTQNLPLAPDDYLYFPPLDIQEVYVLGQVLRPGATDFTEGATVMRVISFAGGFLEKAYRSRVLVLRGSLDAPEAHIINVNKVLSAESPDFKLQPGDIVYIHRRPWAKAEELAELAISEFLRAAIVTWTGQNIGPFIDDPLID